MKLKRIHLNNDGLLCWMQPNMMFHTNEKYTVPVIEKSSGRIILNGVIYVQKKQDYNVF